MTDTYAQQQELERRCKEAIVPTANPRIQQVGLYHPHIRLRVDGIDHPVHKAQIGKHYSLLTIEGFKATVSRDSVRELVTAVTAELIGAVTEPCATCGQPARPSTGLCERCRESYDAALSSDRAYWLGEGL